MQNIAHLLYCSKSREEGRWCVGNTFAAEPCSPYSFASFAYAAAVASVTVTSHHYNAGAAEDEQQVEEDLWEKCFSLS